MAEPEAPADWRGTPITEGALVIYGAPVGRSIALVEAEVVGFTQSGRVNLRILRRAYGGTWSEREVVHVGADRLVVVESLPPSDVPLTSAVIADRKAKAAERRRIRDTHDFPDSYREEVPGGVVYGHRAPAHRYVVPVCTRCGVHPYKVEKECS